MSEEKSTGCSRPQAAALCCCGILLVLALTSFLSPGKAASLTALGNSSRYSHGYAWGVSADGSVVVGEAYSLPFLAMEAFRWTKETGMVGLGRLPAGGSTRAHAVSADGNVVAGYDYYPDNRTQQAFRWTSGGGMVGLGFVGHGLITQAYGMSSDGTIIVGNTGGGAFLWSSYVGMRSIGAFWPWAISGNGRVVVGQSSSGVAVYWTSSDGVRSLPGFGSASGVSADGAVITGWYRLDGQGTNDEAFRWTKETGMVGLGHIPGGVGSLSCGFGVSADGNVIVGQNGSTDQAFIWTPGRGIRPLWEDLVAAGVDPALDGWTMLIEARAVTPDGRFVAGWGQRAGRQEAFVADLAPIAPKILRQTASRVQQEGSRATLKVVVSGVPPPSLQWHFNSAPLEDATNDTYVIPSVTSTDAGGYWVRASNVVGMATGPVTVLGVNNVELSGVFAGLLLSAPAGTQLEVQSASALGNPILWQSVADLTVPASPYVFVDLSSTNGSPRFYRVTQQLRIVPLLTSGWIYTAPVGSQHRIEYVDAEVGYTNWQFLTNLTLPSTPYLFLDRSVTNLVWRYYRTTPMP